MQKKSEEEDEVWKMKRMRRRKDRFSLRSNPGSVHLKEGREKKKREREREKEKEREKKRKRKRKRKRERKRERE